MNAKEEFLKHVIETGLFIKCAEIRICDDRVTLKLDGGHCSWMASINTLDREYDNGYGVQELFGTIWYTDGTWSAREEYDGSEWWVHYTCPEIPPCLN